jgi:hypothetical protein
MAYSGAEPAEAEAVLAEVCAWWRLPPEKLPRLVAALGGRELIHPACVLMLYWIGSLAHRPQLAELLVFAMVRVAAEHGVARELLDVLELQFAVPPKGVRQ